MRRTVVVVIAVLLLGAFGFAAVARPAGDPTVRTTGATAPISRPQPVLAVIGASFSAGVGAGSPSNAWPAVVSRTLGWRLALSADSGAGYVNPGLGHRGPFGRLAANLNLRRLAPAVVIIQGGHDDIGEPPGLVSERVAQLIHLIRAESPGSKVDVLTVFYAGNQPSHAAVVTDTTIVTAARQADPTVTVFDPLAGHWQFARSGDHLHPSAAGHRWIAERLIPTLRRQVP